MKGLARTQPGCPCRIPPLPKVVAAKNAALVTTRGMAGFVHNKVQAIRGCDKPMDFCANMSVTVPVAAACSSRIDLGGVFSAESESASQAVEITIVYAAHVNNAPPPCCRRRSGMLSTRTAPNLITAPPLDSW